MSLDRDHPGFKDELYRRRRNEIAALASSWDGQRPLPSVDYNETEQGIWREIWSHLDSMHQKTACRAYLEGCERFSFSRAQASSHTPGA